MTQTNNNRGVSFLGLMFLLFLGLKLSNVITWSWLWITAPLWAPIATLLVLGGVIFLGALIIEYFKRKG